MDDPALPPADHDAALRGLARLNALSRCHASLWPRVRSLARRKGGTLHVLDVASGGADLPIRMDAVARLQGVRLRWTLTDRSAHALRHGLARARACGLACEGEQVDVLERPLPQADLVINSLFLHHFDGPDVVRILEAMRHAARLAVGASDLRRSRLALGLVWLGSRTLSRSPVVRHDATASVRAAHQPREIRELVDRAGLQDATVQVADPVRWLLWWERGAAA
jgi:2-polyprenyl-3-methyl-5-hydroxy-6-metoxy-1,4-benzoquinol methylase